MQFNASVITAPFEHLMSELEMIKIYTGREAYKQLAQDIRKITRNMEQVSNKLC